MRATSLSRREFHTRQSVRRSIDRSIHRRTSIHGEGGKMQDLICSAKQDSTVVIRWHCWQWKILTRTATGFQHTRVHLVIPNACHTKTLIVVFQFARYRVIHLLMDLGWVDFDLGVPSSCPSAQPLLPNSYQPKQNWADGGTTKNPTQVLGQMNNPVLKIHFICSFS